MTEYLLINPPHGRKSLTSYNKVVGTVNEQDIENYNKIYEKFKDNKLKPNLTINISSLSEFPSYKLKNHIEENNLNITISRKLKTITTILLNHSFINQYYTSNDTSYRKLNLKDKYYCVPLPYLLSNYKKYIKSEDYSSIGKLDKKLMHIDHCLISDEILEDFIKIDTSFNSITQFSSITGKLMYTDWGYKKASENLEFFKNLTNYIEENNLDVIFDESISDNINKESVIDLDTFKILFNMLASTDANNHIIAQELISNHDFELSKPYILFLAARFGYLRNKSTNNKNWGIMYKNIVKHKELISKYWSSRSTIEDVDYFIEKFSSRYPQYKQIICDCLITHLNHQYKTDLIKEIHSL